MAFTSKYIQFAKATSTGVQTVTGVGFRGKALLLWSTHLTSLTNTTGTLQSFGLTDGVLQSCRFIRHPGGEVATTSAQDEQTDHIARKISATSGGAPTVEVAGVFGVFTLDGFTIDWTTNDANADIYHAVVLGGDGFQAEMRQLLINSATNVVSDLSFRPDSFIMMGGAEDASVDYTLGAPYGSIHGYGFANTNADGTFSNTCLWTLGRGTGGASEAQAGASDSVSVSIRVANLSGAAVLLECAISAKSDTGYTITRSSYTATHEPFQHVLALKGVRMAMATISARTSTGTQTTTLPFQPDLLLAQSICATTDSVTGLALAMGVWQRADNAHGGTWIGGISSANPSIYNRSAHASYLIETRNLSTRALSVQAAVSASSPTGVTLNYTHGGATAEKIRLIAFAPLAAIRGSAVFGVTTSVRASRAVAFGLDDAVNELTEEGKLKIFGDFEVTGESTLGAFTVLTADPSSPVNDTWWVVKTGSAPTNVALRVRVAGVTYDIAGLTLP